MPSPSTIRFYTHDGLLILRSWDGRYFAYDDQGNAVGEASPQTDAIPDR